MRVKKTARSLVSRAERSLTPMTIAIEGLVLVGGVVLAVQQARAGSVLTGIGILALTLAGALLGWKIQLLSIAVNKLERATMNGGLASPAGTMQGGRGDATQSKLRHIGTFHPVKAVAAQSGRHAAAVQRDLDAPFRLVAATQRASEPGRVGRTIIALASHDVESLLASHGVVHRLHPSMSAGEIAKLDPQLLVIEEDALDSGPWKGVLAPQGSQLLVELRAAIDDITARGGVVYTLPSRGVPGLAVKAIRSRSSVIDDLLGEKASVNDMPDSLLRDLGRYRHDSGLAQ